MIKDFLLKRKELLAGEEISEFLREKEVSEYSLIQKLSFDKEIYKSEDDAKLWALEHEIQIYDVMESESEWIVVQLPKDQIDQKTIKNIKIDSGIMAVVGLIKVEEDLMPEYFSLMNSGSEFQLSETIPSIIELAKVVKGYHGNYGIVEITKQDLKSFIYNFENRVNGVDLPIYFEHVSMATTKRVAAGWVTSMFTSYDGETLYGEVKWTPKGALSLSDKEFRYFSPEINRNFKHPHTGKEYGPTIMGGALCNDPFLRMEPIVNLTDKNGDTQMEVNTISLVDHEKRITSLSDQISELKVVNEKGAEIIKNQKEEIVQLTDKIKTFEAEKVKAEKEAKHRKLFDENKISKAQFVALNEGKDMYEVLSMNGGLNTGKGTTEGDENEIQLSDAEMKICHNLDIEPKDFAKYAGGR